MLRIGMVLVLLAGVAESSRAAELVRGVRMKLSAGDLASGVAAVEDYHRDKGVDREYLDAVAWLARGAEMLGRDDEARRFVAELRRAIPTETAETVGPLGAAIEVESRLRADAQGRGDALRFLNTELDRAQAPALKSRIRKNINLLSLEGSRAPAIRGLPAAVQGRPRLIFFWAHWCGDCTAQAASLARITARYRPLGLDVASVTRHYGTGADNAEVTPDEESLHIRSVWSAKYPGLADVPLIIDHDAMIEYGVSATPSFVLLDGEGIVRLYAPTRLSEAEMARRIEEVLRDSQ